MKSNDGNILLVANWESDVGYAWWLMENFWITIAEHFGKQSKKSYLIYPNINHLPESIQGSKIEVFECDFHDHSYANLKKIHHIIKTHNLRFIYLSDSASYSIFYLLLRLWGIRSIVVHDHTPGERTPARSWRKALKSAIQRIPCLTADHFIAVTDFVYQRFIDVTCIPANKCSVAANGIIPIDLSNADLQYAQKAFDIPLDRTIVVTTGRASRYKGIDFFIACANELINNQKLDKLHFLFCGDGPDLGYFKTLVEQFKLERNFTFAGKRSDIRELLPSCNIGFHAATGEVGYSLSILEYMSAGLITLVPNLPSVSLATNHMQNGMVYRSRDIVDATKAIRYCLENKENIQIQENATSLIHNDLNLANTNRKLIDILQPIFS